MTRSNDADTMLPAGAQALVHIVERLGHRLYVFRARATAQKFFLEFIPTSLILNDVDGVRRILETDLFVNPPADGDGLVASPTDDGKGWFVSWKL